LINGISFSFSKAYHLNYQIFKTILRNYIWLVKATNPNDGAKKMTDFTQDRFHQPSGETGPKPLGFGTFLVAALIVAALVLGGIKLATMIGSDSDIPNLFPMDPPAPWWGFSA
jgi:hypothetical protein